MPHGSGDRLEAGPAMEGELFLDGVEDHDEDSAGALACGMQEGREDRVARPHEIGEENRSPGTWQRARWRRPEIRRLRLFAIE